MNRLSNLPPGVTDKMIEDWQADDEYTEPDYTTEQVEAAMKVPPCDDDDHDWTEAIHDDDETIRVTYCATCGALKEEG